MLRPRVVHASQATGLPTRRSDGSYTASTHSDGLPDRQDILGRVDIAVMVSPALGTGPSAHTQRERVQQMSTGGTGFATREPSVDCHNRDAGRLRFGFNHADRRADRGVRQGTGQAVVLDQAPEMEVFEIDGIEPTHERRTELVQAIATRISDPLMQARHAAGLCPPMIRTLLRSSQPSLRPRQ